MIIITHSLSRNVFTFITLWYAETKVYQSEKEKILQIDHLRDLIYTSQTVYYHVSVSLDKSDLSSCQHNIQDSFRSACNEKTSAGCGTESISMAQHKHSKSFCPSKIKFLK